MLYHAKKLERFMQKKTDKKWALEPVELVSNKTMLIVGFGDIGAACGKCAKQGFGTRVIGCKRRPEATPAEHLEMCCDQVISLEQLDEYLPSADYVVGVLPATPGTLNMFNAEFFAKMKKTGVFMNIGRGPTCKDVDLAEAINAGTIGGAVLDVYATEPLPESSPLWECKNVLMTPHCADQDPEYLNRAMEIFAENLAAFKQDKPLKNICDKDSGY